MDSREKRTQLVAGIMIRGKGQGPHESSRVGLVWGALIVVAGVLLLLDQMGYVAVGPLFRFWPLILVFFGIGHLFTPSNRAWGVLLLVAGTILQLNELRIIHFRFADLWPLAIIAVGALLMWTALKAPVIGGPKGGSTDKDMMNAVAVLGGVEQRVSSKTFKGGKVTAVLGGIELDFRDADIDGEEAVLEVNCILGGAEIRVPDTWNVDCRSIPILGGNSNKTRLAPADDATGAKRKTLVLTGIVLFGGMEISN